MKKNDQKRCKKVLSRYKPTIGVITKDGYKMQISQIEFKKYEKSHI